MNASERNLLDESDRMTESMLVRLEDWQLAYLRVAMLHEVEETLNAALPREDDHSSTLTDSPARKGGVANSADHACRRAAVPHASAWGYCGKRDAHVNESRVELLEAAR